MFRLPVFPRIGLLRGVWVPKVAVNPRPYFSAAQGRSLLRLGLRAASTATKEGAARTMSWNEFFLLRKRRNRLSTITSVASAVIAASVSFNYFANLVIDFNKRIMGVEVQWIYMGAIVVSGFFGWLVGPFFGTQIFRATIGARRQAFEQMDNIFLRHVARNRPDPSRNNVNYNPLSDFYGEKISSIRDYRHWLREGRLFMKKSEKFL